MKSVLLRDLTHAFTANRPAVSRAIRELHANHPEAFVKAASCVLKDWDDSPGARFVLATLSTRFDFLQILCDPKVFSAGQSATLVRQAKSLDPRIEWKLANLLTGLSSGSGSATSFAAHCMDVLSELSADAAALPALRELLHCTNSRVRSKAALLIGQISRNPQWAKLSDACGDTRVAANAVESVWGLDSSTAKEVFRQAAASAEPRQAVNGAVGLYLAREIEAVSLLFRFARQDAPHFRASAAWGMGRIGDPRFLSSVRALERDPEEVVRKAAARAAKALQKRLATLREQPAVSVQIPAATVEHGEHLLHAVLGEELAGIRIDGLHFALSYAAEPVDHYHFAEFPSGNARLYEFRFYAPQAGSRILKLELFTGRGCGECTAYEVEGPGHGTATVRKRTDPTAH